jgi:hypothetical protein
MPLKENLRALLAAAALCLSTLSLPSTALAQAASAPEAAAPAAAPAGPVVTKETIDNPYGLEALWKQGDFVARGTLVIMIIMSMGSWYIIFTKVFEQRKLLKSAKAASANFWTSGSVKKGMDTLDEGSAFRYIAEEGLKADEHHEGSLVEQIDRHTWITMSVQRAVDNISSRLQDGRLHRAVRRPVRHRLGHLPRVDRDRHRRPGLDRQGGRSGGRGADHDGVRPGCGGAGCDGLQLADPPQQVGDGARARLLGRPAQRAAVRQALKSC